MKYTHSILSLIAAAAFISATGCSKQESTPTPAVEKTTSVQPAAEKPLVADAAPLPVATPAPAPSAVAAPVTPAVESKPANVPPSALQSSLEAQKLAVSQAVTTQVQAVASSATNQLKALATAATNQVLAALGLTNTVSAAVTNQVEALLEKAKMLSNNQKYQEALSAVTQVYNTKLTPEQKQKADDLKAQIQASLTQKASAEASSVLGGLIGGKK